MIILEDAYFAAPSQKSDSLLWISFAGFKANTEVIKNNSLVVF